MHRVGDRSLLEAARGLLDDRARAVLGSIFAHHPARVIQHAVCPADVERAAAGESPIILLQRLQYKHTRSQTPNLLAPAALTNIALTQHTQTQTPRSARTLHFPLTLHMQK